MCPFETAFEELDALVVVVCYINAICCFDDGGGESADVSR